jgi:hypothetical protein
MLNPQQAIGEIVSRGAAARFEGYYNNPGASQDRLRDGDFWTGDLGYRDEKGFYWFAGRTADWLRVDSENFAAAPVEQILSRFPGVTAAAVYPLPDPVTGDQVMAALEVPGGKFDPGAFWSFLGQQADLGTKWAPRLVRITTRLPLTATHKISKRTLRRMLWNGADLLEGGHVDQAAVFEAQDGERERRERGLAWTAEVPGNARLSVGHDRQAPPLAEGVHAAAERVADLLLAVPLADQGGDGQSYVVAQHGDQCLRVSPFMGVDEALEQAAHPGIGLGGRGPVQPSVGPLIAQPSAGALERAVGRREAHVQHLGDLGGRKAARCAGSTGPGTGPRSARHAGAPPAHDLRRHQSTRASGSSTRAARAGTGGPARRSHPPCVPSCPR